MFVMNTHYKSLFIFCMCYLFTDIIVIGVTVGAISVILILLVVFIVLIKLIVIKNNNRCKNHYHKYFCYVVHVYSWKFKLYLMYNYYSLTSIHECKTWNSLPIVFLSPV